MHTKQKEAFKYTSLNRIESQTYAKPSMASKKTINKLSTLAKANTTLVFVDGFYREDLSKLALITGVKFEPAVLSSRKSESALNHSDDYVSSLPFLKVNSTLDGFIIEVKPGVNAGIIEIFFYTSANAERTSARKLVQLRNSIYCHADSQITVIERYIGETAAESLTNSVTEVQLDTNARLDHIKIQTEATLTDHIGQLFVDLSKNSTLNSYMLSYGANLARNEVHTRLLQEHATSNLYGLFMPQKNQHMDQYTVMDHVSSHANSHEFYRGILSDNARGVFNGKVMVRPDAQKTVTRQINNNLLLSSNAEIDTKPELQIYADDVQCSHGATVGHLDEQALFYMQARGVPLAEAKNILLSAFATEILQSISDLALRDQLQTDLLAYLPGASYGQ